MNEHDATASPVALGVNYTPRKDWFHSWVHPDWASVADDFAAISALGCDHIRIFPLWPLLQPNRALIDDAAIANVVRMCEVAADANLNVSVDCLQGHLSSYDFLPSWVTSWHRRNLFTDPDVIDGQRALVTRLATALRELPNTTGVTLGNEFIQFAAPRHPFQHECTPAQARDWTATLLDAAATAWSDGAHHHSFDDDLWFVDDHPFTPELATTLGAQTTVHSWIFMQVGPRFGRLHPALPAFARYLCELAAAWSPDPLRPIWLQEVGAPHTWIDDVDAPAFVTDTIRAVADLPQLSAITWWCSHDVSRELADFPALEHRLGLIDEDGTIKPTGEAFAAAARELPTWRAATSVADYLARPAIDVPLAPDGTNRSLASPTSETFTEWLAAWRSPQPARLRRCPAPEGGHAPS
ncbi:hypothetical protein BSZ39_08565 [Bowdeniella nasicola]|uniref:Glycosyl hydrolase n=1 Tax=Bowdeniella nasicola TaxID=208480 RepID=A0A1Q5Q1P0_9ACTO|nr:hypothetical protein [Bowdeniella nasicola]OKL53629.1 hypothetical protein BSZ39_08565 [Bowdeniella nasicola]